MTKATEHYTRCEHCDKAINLYSPPLRQYYTRGRVDIGDNSAVLLDRPSKSGYSHAASLTGMYCDLDCLIAHIKELRAKAGKPESQQG